MTAAQGAGRLTNYALQRPIIRRCAIDELLENCFGRCEVILSASLLWAGRPWNHPGMDKDPRSQNSDHSVLGPWIAWIVACTLLPVLPFLLLGRRGIEDGMGLIVFALLVQFFCSIYLAIAISQKLHKGAGHAVLMSMAFIIGSVIVGCVSYFAGCAGFNFMP